MKKKHGVFFGLVVLFMAAMFTLAGCDNGTTDNGSDGGGSGGNDGGDGGNGGGGAALVAKWYATQDSADAEDSTYLIFEFTSDGKLLSSGQDAGNTYTATGTTSGTITVKYGGTAIGTSNYSISGTVLTLSGSVPPAGTYYKKST
jgi:hypothetical protein